MNFLEDIRPFLREAWRKFREAKTFSSSTAGGAELSPGVRRILTGTAVVYLSLLLGVPLALLARDAFSEGFMGAALALGNPDAWKALRWSLLLAPAALFVNVVCGTIVAWVLARHRFPGCRVLAALVDAPLALSPAVAGYVLVLVLGREGYLRWPFGFFGVQAAFAWPGTFLALIFVSMPLVTRQVLTALRTIPVRDGDAEAGFREIFRRMRAPRVRWAVFHGAGLTLARGLGEFGMLSVVGGALAGGGETAPLFLLRAMDERMTTAVGAVSLVLAGTTFFFTAAGGAFLRWREAAARARKKTSRSQPRARSAPKKL